MQGLADAFILMRYPFDSEEAQHLNKQIFETIYYAALESSCELAEKLGPYETYDGCPVSKGVGFKLNIITFRIWELFMVVSFNMQILKTFTLNK